MGLMKWMEKYLIKEQNEQTINVGCYVIELNEGEYYLSSESPTAENYEIYYNGKKLNDVVGVVRSKIHEDLQNV